ncbi:hypothetical protein CEXT_666601 [Caerostris extrusa]|uniref:Uncharacterized protein n=1 Tax=Caerostris extrusa TaxID=172846 RepID=A0AAV4MXE4_CAEEX|nr:hypothetical protein CEXT_666601 [Caerostris extrusa]
MSQTSTSILPWILNRPEGKKGGRRRHPYLKSREKVSHPTTPVRCVPDCIETSDELEMEGDFFCQGGKKVASAFEVTRASAPSTQCGCVPSCIATSDEMEMEGDFFCQVRN